MSDLIGFEFEVEDPEVLGGRATATVISDDPESQYVGIKVTCSDGALFGSCRLRATVRSLKESGGSQKVEKANAGG